MSRCVRYIHYIYILGKLPLLLSTLTLFTHTCMIFALISCPSVPVCFSYNWVSSSSLRSAVSLSILLFHLLLSSYLMSEYQQPPLTPCSLIWYELSKASLTASLNGRFACCETHTHTHIWTHIHRVVIFFVPSVAVSSEQQYTFLLIQLTFHMCSVALSIALLCCWVL